MPHPKSQHTGGSALRSRGLQVLVATFVATGAIFGGVDVVTVAFAEERGHKAAASLVLAVYALGSCLAGAVFGLLHLKGNAATRWLVGVGAMAVSMIPSYWPGTFRCWPWRSLSRASPSHRRWSPPWPSSKRTYRAPS